MTSAIPAKQDQTSFRQFAPRLTANGLSILLCAMCAVPIVTIAVLWASLPPVKINTLQATVTIKNAPPTSYYELPTDQRIPLPEVQLVLTNTGQQAWTNLFVRVNHDYTVFESGGEFRPGESREYFLNRFSSRTGAFYDVRYNPVRDVMIYARLPDHSRATFTRRFD
jgi:hypothetical protein